MQQHHSTLAAGLQNLVANAVKFDDLRDDGVTDSDLGGASFWFELPLAPPPPEAAS